MLSRVPALLLRLLLTGAPLLIGVTLLSFLLMVHFGPEQTYLLLGKNPTPEQVAEVRQQLGYDRPFLLRYLKYLHDLATLDLGYSHSSGEAVAGLLARTVPVSLALLLPPFFLGHAAAIVLALHAVQRRGAWLDRLLTGAAVTLMSLSYVIVIIALQALLSSEAGLGWFPVRGWSTSGPLDYLRYETVPALCVIAVTLGYNIRFYRAAFAETAGEPHVLAARAYGAPAPEIRWQHLLRPNLGLVITQVLYTVPLIVVGGGLLIETFFGIPGAGRVTFDAIVNGDQPVLKAIVGLTAVLFLLARLAADFLHRLADPRVAE